MLNHKDNLLKSDVVNVAKRVNIPINGTKEHILNKILIKYNIDKNLIYNYSNVNHMRGVLKSNGIKPSGNKRDIFTKYVKLVKKQNKLKKDVNANNYTIVTHAEQGRREYMEDYRYVFQNGSIVFNAIFDGHGGKECAAFLKNKLFQNFKETIRSYNKINNSLKKVFFQTNQEYLRSGKNSGSTCNLLIIIKDTNTFYVANTGDSRAILCMKNGDVLQLSKDHKPNDMKEKHRIEQSGGFVRSGRVNGILAMSRSFGDKDISEYLTSDPDIIKGNLTQNAEFFVQASDGLYDVLTNRQICSFVKSLRERNVPLTNIPKLLVNHAIKIGSQDNVSAIITFIS